MIEILKSGLTTMKNDLKNKNIKKQIANILTLSRFFSPFILIPLYYLNKKTIFIIMIIIFALTDTFDGYFARRYKSVNLFGRYLDAVVDKIFANFDVGVKISSNFNKYIFIIIIFEILIMIVNLYAFYKKLNPKTIYLGKIKTTLLFFLISLYYLKIFINFNNIYLNIVVIITIIFQIITLISYILNIKKDKL